MVVAPPLALVLPITWLPRREIVVDLFVDFFEEDLPVARPALKVIELEVETAMKQVVRAAIYMSTICGLRESQVEPPLHPVGLACCNPHLFQGRPCLQRFSAAGGRLAYVSTLIVTN